MSRKGCDLNPIDVSTPPARRLLRSFVWPEHVERLGRLDAALSAVPPAQLDASDACSWPRSQLARLQSGVTTVVFHSIVLPYLGEEQRRLLEQLIREAGNRADRDHRLAWVSLEPSTDPGEVHLVCERWPERERTRLAIRGRSVCRHDG